MLKGSLFVRSLIREWKSGEMTLLALALFIAVTCISTINFFTSLLDSQLHNQASQLLGADRLLTSSQAISPQWRQKAQQLGVQETVSLSFFSMLVHEDHLQLAQIRAIQTPYPLLGEIKLLKKVGISKANGIPPPGHVWVAPRLLGLLHLQLGDRIRIGSAEFTVDASIQSEPGQSGDWFNIAPHVLMNDVDVAKTDVIQVGSRLVYSWLLAGKPAQLVQLQAALRPQLSIQEEWHDSEHNNPFIDKTLLRTRSILQITTLLSLVLAGIAISLASFRFNQRHQTHVALLRCFGATQRHIIRYYFMNLFLLGFLASLFGTCLGYLLQPLLTHWLEGLLPNLNPSFSWKPAVLSFAAGMLLLFSFTVLNTLQLGRISPMTLFRQQQINWQRIQFLNYLIAFLILGMLAYFYTYSLQITTSILAVSLVYVGFVIGLLGGLFQILLSFKRHFSLNWRLAIINIARQTANSALQIIGIGLALTVIVSLVLLRTQLIDDWRQQLPDKAPNYFLININPDQVSDMGQWFQQKEIANAPLYPMVRGRLILINNQTPEEKLGPEAQQINALRRELNFSWTDALPSENKVIAGIWSPKDPSDWVSIEKGLADRLQVKLGDQLSVLINEQKYTARVTSIRQVNWTTFKPNFFLLFRPGFLDKSAATFITSFYLPDEQQNLILTFNQRYPNVTLIDLSDTMSKVRLITTNASYAIHFLTLFALLIGLIIAALAMLANRDQKWQQTKLLKMLGMRYRQLLFIQNSEALLLGLFSGLLAAASATELSYYLTTQILELRWSFPWHLFLLLPIFSALLQIGINQGLLWRHYGK